MKDFSSSRLDFISPSTWYIVYSWSLVIGLFMEVSNPTIHKSAFSWRLPWNRIVNGWIHINKPLHSFLISSGTCQNQKTIKVKVTCTFNINIKPYEQTLQVMISNSDYRPKYDRSSGTVSQRVFFFSSWMFIGPLNWQWLVEHLYLQAL